MLVVPLAIPLLTGSTMRDLRYSILAISRIYRGHLSTLDSSPNMPLAKSVTKRHSDEGERTPGHRPRHRAPATPKARR